ncbi:hypothetical protein A28LD_1569 [Idiomarina sp. A28L]|uniref:hypothetical protein n=1 Tax=Idiomarina sp. A28L TaxID=1036674 RepID=UPI0002138BAE|nr:hypothetical protein [Idiomarina sp. A28L]EGN75106.1 hypothetical protein A28LD_1569 [Idiomarina sp. A28L]
MKELAKNPYHAWTPDLQVKALKRLGLSIFVAAFGVFITFVSNWFELPSVFILVSFIGVFVSITVAPIIFFSSGILSSENPNRLPTFTDEFCRHVIYQAYRAVAWGLILLSLFVFLLADLLLSTLSTVSVSVSQISGLFALSGMLIWAITVVRLVSDEEQDE